MDSGVYGSEIRSQLTNLPLQCITEAMEAIANNRPEELERWLAILPLDKISLESGDQLLAMLLIQSWEYQCKKAIKSILTAWERVYPREERVPFHVIMFTIDLLPAELLKFVMIDCLTGITFFTVMTELANIHTPEVAIACEKAWQAFGYQPIEVLRTLEALAKEERNAALTNFLATKIPLESEYAPIPSWVKDFRSDPVGLPVTELTDEASLPSYEDTKYTPPLPLVKLPSDEKIINLLVKSLEEYSYDQVDISSVGYELSKQLILMTDQQKSDLIKPELVRLACLSRQNDPNLCRLYGPSNATINSSVDEMLYGGERMFLSLIINNEADDDIGSIKDWFTGYCDICKRKIRRRWHAVRLPNESGGWTNCLCSWDHARQLLLEPTSYDNLIQVNLITIGLIDQVEKQIRQWGVQDRRDNGDILPLDDGIDLVPTYSPALFQSALNFIDPELIEKSASLVELANQADQAKQL